MNDSTGIIKKVDDLGRVVIPEEIRERLGIRPNSEVSFMTHKDYITIRPIQNTKSCFSCGHTVMIDDSFCPKCGAIVEGR